MNAPWNEQADMDDVEQLVAEPEGPWRIDSLGAAEWAMGKLRESQTTVDQLRAQYDAWKADLDRWLADAAAPAQRAVEFFTGHLERYALTARELDPKAATVKLPSGKITTRKNPAAVIVDDEDELLAAAFDTMVPDANGELCPLIDLVTTRKVAPTQLREHVKIVEREVTQLLVYPCNHYWEANPGQLPDQCPLCGVDGPTVVPVVEHVVMTLNGHELPGAGIRPETVTATVKPGSEPAALVHLQTLNPLS